MEQFVAIADERSITRAAARLFAAQSTVSSGLQSLERELGVRLVNRTSRSVSLTAAGENVLTHARAMLDAMQRMRDASAQSDADISGRVRIGVFANLDLVGLESVIGRFHRRHPRVELVLAASPAGTTGLLADVRTGRLDLAFVATADTVPGVRLHPLFEAEFRAYLPAEHPLANRSSITLLDLAAERWIETSAGYGNRLILDRVLHAAGINRGIIAEVGDLPAAVRYVAAGLGVAVLPAVAAPDGCAAVAVADAIPTWRLAVATAARTAPSRAAASFIAEVHAEVATDSDPVS